MRRGAAHLILVVGEPARAAELQRAFEDQGADHAAVVTGVTSIRRSLVLGENDYVVVCIALSRATLDQEGQALRALLSDHNCFPTKFRTVGLLSEARLAAIASGTARVTIAAAPWRVWSEVGDSLMTVAGLEMDFGVTVELSRGRLRTEIAYNALGLGRVASETLVFRRGDSVTTLVVSSLGRARRR